MWTRTSGILCGRRRTVRDSERTPLIMIPSAASTTSGVSVSVMVPTPGLSKIEPERAMTLSMLSFTAVSSTWTGYVFCEREVGHLSCSTLMSRP